MKDFDYYLALPVSQKGNFSSDKLYGINFSSFEEFGPNDLALPMVYKIKKASLKGFKADILKMGCDEYAKVMKWVGRNRFGGLEKSATKNLVRDGGRAILNKNQAITLLHDNLCPYLGLYFN